MSPESTQAECHQHGCRGLGAPEVGAEGKVLVRADSGSSELLGMELKLHLQMLLCLVTLALPAFFLPSSLAAAPP